MPVHNYHSFSGWQPETGESHIAWLPLISRTMPQCSNCGVTRTRFPAGCTLCANCRARDGTNNDADPISETIISELTESLGEEDGSVEDIMNASLPDLTVVQFIKIITVIIKPLKEESSKKIVALENRVTCLESENKQLKENSGVMSDIIVSMQRSLNKLDSEERTKNIMVSGLPEEDTDGMVFQDPSGPLTTDTMRIKTVLTKLQVPDLSENILNNLTVDRIGRVREGHKRLVKVVLPSVKIRNDILDNTKKLKTMNEPWSRIYINKDVHPVYQQENRRMSTRFKTLKNDPENAEKAILLTKGKLTVDGVVVDQNRFFQ